MMRCAGKTASRQTAPPARRDEEQRAGQKGVGRPEHRRRGAWQTEEQAELRPRQIGERDAERDEEYAA